LKPTHGQDTSREQAADGADDDSGGGGAFGKSAFIVTKSHRAAPPALKRPEDILAHLDRAFPPPERALACFHADRESLSALSHVAQRAARLAGESGGTSAAGVSRGKTSNSGSRGVVIGGDAAVAGLGESGGDGGEGGGTGGGDAGDSSARDSAEGTLVEGSHLPKQFIQVCRQIEEMLMIKFRLKLK
jgi:hypothetical protein